jgi:hypothetical protein
MKLAEMLAQSGDIAPFCGPVSYIIRECNFLSDEEVRAALNE